MTTLTTLTVKQCQSQYRADFQVYRAYYSDGDSLLISKNDAEGLSKTYNVRIENETT